MKYDIERTESYSLAYITRPGERIVVMKISADIHECNTARMQALGMMYTEALVSGCKGYDRTAFQEAISLLGASISVDIDNGQFAISVRTIATNADNVFKLLSCMMTSPTFAQDQFKRIRTLCVNELREQKEDAKSMAADNLVNKLYTKDDRRYSYDPDTLIAEIPKITKKDLQAMHAQVLHSFWYCTVAGNTAAVRSCKKTISEITPSEAVVRSGRHAQKSVRSSVTLANIPSKQNIEFSIGGPLPMTLHHPDLLPFIFGLNVLGKWGGFTGRLMSTVREKEGLTYGIYARTEAITGTEQGYWRIMTFFAPAVAEQGLKSTLREVRSIAKKGITKEEYTRFKTILETQQSLLQDSLVRSLGELHGYHTAGFTRKEMQEHKQRLLTVSRPAVNAALKKYLNMDTCVISGAGPVTRVKKTLTKLL